QITAGRNGSVSLQLRTPANLPFHGYTRIARYSACTHLRIIFTVFYRWVTVNLPQLHSSAELMASSTVSLPDRPPVGFLQTCRLSWRVLDVWKGLILTDLGVGPHTSSRSASSLGGNPRSARMRSTSAMTLSRIHAFKHMLPYSTKKTY